MKNKLASVIIAFFLFIVFVHEASAQNSDITLPASPPTLDSPSPGDINGDKIVNLLDYTLLSKAYGTDNTASDLNHDKVVDLLDFTILNSNFGSTV
jgi:hypothetical protein